MYKEGELYTRASTFDRHHRCNITETNNGKTESTRSDAAADDKKCV